LLGAPTRRAAQQHQRQAPRPANPQHLNVGGGVPDAPAAAPKTSATSGEFAVSQCRERRPRRSGSNSGIPINLGRIRSHPIVGKGLALSAQHMARHGRARANPLHVCGFARGRRTSGQSLPEGASPFPTGRRLRIRPKMWKTGGASLRGAPGSARPTGVNADSPDGLLRFRAAARNAGDGVPYRAYADSPDVCDDFAIAAGGRPWADAAPY